MPETLASLTWASGFSCALFRLKSTSDMFTMRPRAAAPHSPEPSPAAARHWLAERPVAPARPGAGPAPPAPERAAAPPWPAPPAAAPAAVAAGRLTPAAARHRPGRVLAAGPLQRLRVPALRRGP